MKRRKSLLVNRSGLTLRVVARGLIRLAVPTVGFFIPFSVLTTKRLVFFWVSTMWGFEHQDFAVNLYSDTRTRQRARLHTVRVRRGRPYCFPSRFAFPYSRDPVAVGSPLHTLDKYDLLVVDYHRDQICNHA